MKILIAGEGGQGVQLTGELLAFAAFLKNKKASVIPNFGVEQRGGVSLAFLIIDEEGDYPKFQKADIVAVFCDRAIERIERYVNPKTEIICGPSVTEKIINADYVDDQGLPNKVWNIIVLKNILDKTNILNKNDLKEALIKKLGGKLTRDPLLMEANLKALGIE